MEIQPLSQLTLVDNSYSLSRMDSREMLFQSRESMGILFSGDGDTVTISRENTVSYRETTYSAEALRAGEMPTQNEPSPAGQTDEAAAAGQAAFSQAFNQYLELIRQRVEYLVSEAGRTADEYRERLGVSTGIETGGVSKGQEAETPETTAGALEKTLFSAENTADRIVQFALSFYQGGDRKEYAEMAREAVMKGFNDAMEALGGYLPEVSHRTIELVNKALDRFAAGTDFSVSA